MNWQGDLWTLALFRLNPIKTKKRSPGPGPFRSGDWKHIAERMLKNRQIILHTDGADPTNLPYLGSHDNVVHKRKKVQVRGKTMWIKPHYTKVCSHKLPDGKVLKVKAGTQIVDRFWGHLRSYVKHTHPQSRVGLACSKGACCPVDLLATNARICGQPLAPCCA